MCCCTDTYEGNTHNACFQVGRLREQGQATVESAILLPVFFIVLLLLLQPAIVLYDRVVMEGAASETCRLLATKTDSLGSMDENCEAFVRHRLGAIPPLPIFHLHEPTCSWEITLVGDEHESQVGVRIAHEIRPLPLFDVGARLAGLTNERGNFELLVESTQPVYAPWVLAGQDELSPGDWIGEW